MLEPDDFRPPEVPLTEDQRLMRKRVLHQVETEPESFYMGTWQATTLAPCGTTRCVAGWAVHFAQQDHRASYKDEGSLEYLRQAVALLGLTAAEYGYSGIRPELFYASEATALARLKELASE